MAAITFSRKTIEKQIKLTPEVVEKINMLGTAVESLDEKNICIEVLPNRPDLLSESGFIRALKSFLGKETGLARYKIHPSEKNYKVKIDPSLKGIRPHTACAIVKGIKFDDGKIKEIIDLQEKLHATVGRNRKKLAIGIYPLEKITLPIRFEAKNPKDIKFIPLEMDKEMNGLEILQKHPAGRCYAHLLSGLEKYPVFSDSKGNILSMPPIINSHETGKVSEKTDSIFIECSGFDFNILKKTLNIIVTTLAEMGGKIYSMEMNYDGKKIITPNLAPEVFDLSLENTNKLLGLDLKEKELGKLLEKMGYEYKNKKVKVPAWRTDVIHEVDLIEDIAIAYGYENFVPEIPNISSAGVESEESLQKKKITEILIGLGFNEILTYHLIKNEEAKMHKIEPIELENAKTEYKSLRPNLLIPALRILSENKDNEYPQKIFEIGTVFRRDENKETGIREDENLIIAITPANFTEIKQVLDYLCNSLGKSYSLKEENKYELIEGRTGAIILKGADIGYLGEVHPDTLRDWGIKLPISVLELNLSKLMK